MTVKITEREVAAELAGELDALLQSGGYPFEKATVESHAGSGYPDIVLWQDYASRQAFAFWELKAPGLREDLTKLPNKAQSLGVSFVVVWNFQSGTLYKVDGERLIQLKSYPNPLLAKLEDWRIVPKRQQVIDQAQRILADLVNLHQQGNLHTFVPDKIYFIAVLHNAVEKLTPLLEQRILAQRGNRTIQKELSVWIKTQGIQDQPEEYFPVIARQWAYSVALRILFYFTVRRHFNHLPNLQHVTGSSQTPIDLLKQAFSQAQAVDWQAVFEQDLLDRIGLPPSVNPILADLLKSFHEYDFGLLKEDVIGEILEGLIPPEERHALGQYFTREDLIDFIIGFVADHQDNAAYLDPTCGSGTFLNRLYSRLRWLSQYRADHAQLLGQIWGVDIAKFPATLATINLFRQNVRDTSNFPRVVTRDFFGVAPNQTFDFPPPHATVPGYQKVQVPIPAFDGIVGNFPYIRQELIQKVDENNKREITHAVAQQWFWRDRELFVLDGIRPKELEAIETKSDAERTKWLHKQIDDGRIDLRLSGQADIYAYLFLHTASFLQEGGRIGVVTSNSWLDVNYGLELKRFFFHHFKVIAVVASWAEPWFQDAAVNTVFTILERCEDAVQRDANITRFVKIKRPLAEMLPQELLTQENDRWLKVDALVRQVRDADANAVNWQAMAQGTATFTGIKTVENDDFRIRLISQAELHTEADSKGEQAKWGKYLRAPQVYFNLQQDAGDKLVPLTTLADVRRGYTTGINDFFLLEVVGDGKKKSTLCVKSGRGEEFEIEKVCLRPIISSPKEAQQIEVDLDALPCRLFLPPLKLDGEKKSRSPKKLLLENGWTGAHKYVEWGEKQRTAQDVPWDKVPSVAGRQAWWFLGERESADFLLNRFVDKRFFLPEVGKFLVGDTFFVGAVKNRGDVDVTIAILNSSMYLMEIEVNGRVNLGDGLLTFYGPDIQSTLMPSPSVIPNAARKKNLGCVRQTKKAHGETHCRRSETKRPPRVGRGSAKRNGS